MIKAVYAPLQDEHASIVSEAHHHLPGILPKPIYRGGLCGLRLLGLWMALECPA